MTTIALIGGGAAGMMAAAAVLESNAAAEIHLFEKNASLGAKVIISGGGRCNVTTGITDRKILKSKYTRGADFLKTALGEFSPRKVMEWFEAHGVPLKTEEDLRVFPVSDNGRDVVGAFEMLFRTHDVRLHLGESVKSVEPVDRGRFKLESNTGSYEFDFVVLTTGGNAYGHTGSTGDGYIFAQACGHTITPLGPSLNSFLTGEEWPRKISGISLEKVKLEAVAEDGEKKTAIGPMLFTHFGISGPATFALSSHLAFTSIEKNSPLKIRITPVADRNFDAWDRLLREATQKNGTQQIHNVLGAFLPHRFAEVVLQLAEIPLAKKSAELSQLERKTMVHLLSGKLELALLQRRAGDEFVTAGGVRLDEVDAKTMESKICPHLFFAGEILDIDGLTGGFNLQASWATGRLAGRGISRAVETLHCNVSTAREI